MCLTLSVSVLVALSGCSDEQPTAPVPVDTQNSLVFTRENQTQIVFPGTATLYVWCGPWESGSVNTPTVHVRYGGPTANDPFWQLSAVVSDVRLGQALQFPNRFVFDQPKGADIFLFDPSNELSSQADGSSGSITFQRLTCSTGADGVVEFSMNARIGSEFAGGPSVTAIGTFRSRVGPVPAFAAGRRKMR